VHEVLARCVPRDRYVPALERVVAQHSEVTRQLKRLRICRVRGWTNAESRERRALVRRLDDLDVATNTLRRDLSAGAVSPPSLRTVLDDLREIETEFGGIRFD